MKTLLSTFILSCLMLNLYVFAKPHGLTLKLISYDSPESPLYLGNLTYGEKLQKMVNQSKARAYHLSSMASITTNHSMIRVPVGVANLNKFLVQVGIGTFLRESPSYKTYYLVFDTGANLIWTQCEDCRTQGNHCFNQNPPALPNSQSSSFQSVPWNDNQYCTTNMRKGDVCKYQVGYDSGQSSTGIVAHEKFSFPSDGGSIIEDTVPVTMGCGYDQLNFNYPEDNKIAGILGMGFSSSGTFRSFVDQIDLYSNGRFSYCISSMSNSDHPPPSFLRFGADIPEQPHSHSTTLYKYLPDPGYYLNLKDISIANRQLHIPEHFFVRGSQGSGFIIDSGTTLSRIVEGAFQVLDNAITDYFPKDSGIYKIPGKYGYDLCFAGRKTTAFTLPNMTFHFEGEAAEFEVQPENLFVLGEDYFCLAVLKSTANLNVLGAYQQRDQRITYDTKYEIKSLRFNPEDCARNP